MNIWLGDSWERSVFGVDNTEQNMLCRETPLTAEGRRGGWLLEEKSQAPLRAQVMR